MRAPVHDFHDVGMVQTSCGLELRLESSDERGIGGIPGKEHGNGDRQICGVIMGQEHLRCVIAADPAMEFVTATKNRVGGGISHPNIMQ